MGKRKKQRRTPQRQRHVPPTSPSWFSRRDIVAVLTGALGNLLFDGVKMFVRLFVDKTPVRNVPTVVTLHGPSIGPTSQTFPGSVEPVVQERTYVGLVALRINVSSSISFEDSIKIA
jgi:hypothetical protein